MELDTAISTEINPHLKSAAKALRRKLKSEAYSKEQTAKWCRRNLDKPHFSGVVKERNLDRAQQFEAEAKALRKAAKALR